jgi:hypothetical protein
MSDRFRTHRIGITSRETIVIDDAQGGRIVAAHQSGKAARADAARRNAEEDDRG